MSGNASRLQTVEQITNRAPIAVEKPDSLENIWAVDVFNLEKMEKALSKGAFDSITKTIQTGDALSEQTADEIATAMKEWALSHDVKLFSHIFYPMTNATAEKHDAFIVTDFDGGAI